MRQIAPYRILQARGAIAKPLTDSAGSTAASHAPGPDAAVFDLACTVVGRFG